MTIHILVLYYSKHGTTLTLARAIARGVEAAGAKAIIRTVPELCTVPEMATAPEITTAPEIARQSQAPASLNENSDPFVTLDELKHCDGLALGSPVRFGNMAAPLKHFIDSTSKLWLEGCLVSKPAIVFNTGSMLHGGQESTLQSMMLPLLHHGMLVLGLPHYAEALHQTDAGGTLYGATKVTHNKSYTLSAEEKKLAIMAGKRLAGVAAKLAAP